jgi:hypothetical protein
MSVLKAAKALKAKEKGTGLSPRRPAPLNTLAGVLNEMARLYRLSLKGKLPADEFTKYIYGLKEMRGCLEAMVLDDVQSRLSALTSKVEARRHAN